LPLFEGRGIAPRANRQPRRFAAVAVAGRISIQETSRPFGGGLVASKEICANCAGHVTALIGYRCLHASDKLSIDSSSVALGCVVVSDHFDTSNNFHGLDLGLTGKLK
jgi:Putative beta barrel porin-7 (BBP7)